MRGGRGWVLAQQRDGGFQPDSGPNRHHRADRHAGQSDRSREADAQLASADPGAQGRSSARGDRLARRPDHSQHHAVGRSQSRSNSGSILARPSMRRGLTISGFPDRLVAGGSIAGPRRPARRCRPWAITSGRPSTRATANTIVVDPSSRRIHGVADHRRATSKASGD